MKTKYSCGEGTQIWEPVNLYGCVIGKNCIIAAFTEIQQDVHIGDNCKIQMGAFIPTGVVIEDRVFIGPHVTFTNDKYPGACNKDGSLKRSGDWKCTPTLVRSGASIGAAATILPGICIGENALIGAGSVITKNVPKDTTVKGKW